MLDKLSENNYPFINVFINAGKIRMVKIYQSYDESRREMDVAGYDQIYPGFYMNGVIRVLPEGKPAIAENFITLDQLDGSFKY